MIVSKSNAHKGIYMNTNTYYAAIKEKLSANYDVYDAFLLGDMPTDLYAHFYARNEKYIATKSATIYAFENNEHTFLKHFEKLTFHDIHAFEEALKSSIPELVDPHSEHMSSRLSGVMVTNHPLSREVVDYVQSFKYQKTFWFGLRGWVDICLIIVNLSDHSVIASKKAKKMAPHFSPEPLQ